MPSRLEFIPPLLAVVVDFMMGRGTQEQVAMHLAFAGMGSVGLALFLKK
ncbi:hypothetical protein H6784_01215 [Candidatus Nomurabacteria bacterium]|nr:hypothetical protein [Candidatus Kaiserbacteria bacterium]MCB9814013.1 hypothetical protein [Candidatus Nomurabacteria bacterium]